MTFGGRTFEWIKSDVILHRDLYKSKEKLQIDSVALIRQGSPFQGILDPPKLRSSTQSIKLYTWTM